MPLPAWLRGQLASWAKRRDLRPLAWPTLGFFDFDYIDELWRRHLDGVQDHSFDLWCLINLGAWYEHWIEGEGGMSRPTAPRSSTWSTASACRARPRGSSTSSTGLDPAATAPVVCFDAESSALADRLRERGVPVEVDPLPRGLSLQGGGAAARAGPPSAAGRRPLLQPAPDALRRARRARLGVRATVGSLSAFACLMPDASTASCPRSWSRRRGASGCATGSPAGLMRTVVDGVAHARRALLPLHRRRPARACASSPTASTSSGSRGHGRRRSPRFRAAPPAAARRRGRRQRGPARRAEGLPHPAPRVRARGRARAGAAHGARRRRPAARRARGAGARARHRRPRALRRPLATTCRCACARSTSSCSRRSSSPTASRCSRPSAPGAAIVATARQRDPQDPRRGRASTGRAGSSRPRTRRRWREAFVRLAAGRRRPAGAGRPRARTPPTRHSLHAAIDAYQQLYDQVRGLARAGSLRAGRRPDRQRQTDERNGQRIHVSNLRNRRRTRGGRPRAAGRRRSCWRRSRRAAPTAPLIHEQSTGGRRWASARGSSRPGGSPRQPVVARGADPGDVLVCDGHVFADELRAYVRGARAAALRGDDDVELLRAPLRAGGAERLGASTRSSRSRSGTARRRRLVLARDPLGVRSLYYRATPTGVIFASEIKALLAVPDVPAEVDEVAVVQYLTFLTVPGPRTLFSGISKLPAGLDRDARRQRRAPTSSRTGTCSGIRSTSATTRSYYVDRVRELHDGAVGGAWCDRPDRAPCQRRQRLQRQRGDHGAQIKEAGGDAPLHTFTVGLAEFEGDTKYNDLIYASRSPSASARSTTSACCRPTSSSRPSRETIEAQDDLVSEPSSVFLFHALRMAKDAGRAVVITGEANDELCCGHGGMVTIRDGYYTRWLPLMRLPRPLQEAGGRRRAAAVAEADRRPPPRRRRRGVLLELRGRLARVGEGRHPVAGGAARRRRATSAGDDRRARRASGFDASAHGERDYLNYMIYAMMQDNYFGNLMLSKLDLLSAQLGLESRCPYTEPAYAHLVYNVPAKFKPKDGMVKYFFKKAIDGVLPDDIIYRPKQGFRTPGGGAVPRAARATGAGGAARRRLHPHGLLAPRHAGAAAARAPRPAATVDHSNRLWTVLMLNLWHQRWIGGECARPTASATRRGSPSWGSASADGRSTAVSSRACSTRRGRAACAVARRCAGCAISSRRSGGRSTSWRPFRTGALRRLLRHAYANVPLLPAPVRARPGITPPRHPRRRPTSRKLPILGRDEARDDGAQERTADRGRAPSRSRRAPAAPWAGRWCSATSASSEYWRQAMKLRGYGWAGYRPGQRSLHYWGAGPPARRQRADAAVAADATSRSSADRALRREHYVDCGRRGAARAGRRRRATIRREQPEVILCYSQAGADLARHVRRARTLRDWDTIPVICGAERLLSVRPRSRSSRRSGRRCSRPTAAAR